MMNMTSCPPLCSDLLPSLDDMFVGCHGGPDSLHLRPARHDQEWISDRGRNSGPGRAGSQEHRRDSGGCRWRLQGHHQDHRPHEGHQRVH